MHTEVCAGYWMINTIVSLKNSTNFKELEVYMKKLAMVTSLIGVLALAACGGGEETPETEETGTEETGTEGTDTETETDTEEDTEDGA